MSDKSAHTPERASNAQVLRLLNWLTRPHPSITDIEIRRQTSLLAAITLVIIITSAIALLMLIFLNQSNPANLKTISFLVPAQLFTLSLYFLNRSGRYRISALLMVMLHFTLCHVAAVATDEITWLFFTSITVILAGILLSPRWTLGFFVATLATQIVLMAVHPIRVMISSSGSIAVFLMTASLVIVFITHRNGLEKARQRELRHANDALRASETMLEERVIERTEQLDTARKEAENARLEAERANQIKSQFLANMSHELRTPLNSILNFTAFVADGIMGPVNDEQIEALQQSISSGKHLLALINDVLDITKIEAGLMDMFVQQVDLNEALNVIVSMSKGLVKGKSLTLNTEIDTDLPITFGDKRRLRQVFLNIVSNAVKFTREGSITIRARKQGANSIRFEVQDTGIGIAEQDYTLVFESFKQAKHDLLDTPGTGLGMPISRYFVMSHGGRIWFESTLGVGTTFFVELPILTEDEANTLANNNSTAPLSA